MNKCEKCGFLHYRTDKCRVRKAEIQAPHATQTTSIQKPDRNKSRHRPGYFTEYMREYRKRPKLKASKSNPNTPERNDE